MWFSLKQVRKSVVQRAVWLKHLLNTLLYINTYINESYSDRRLYSYLMILFMCCICYPQRLYIIDCPIGFEFNSICHQFVTDSGYVIGTLRINPYSGDRSVFPFIWSPKGISVLPSLRRYDSPNCTIEDIITMYPLRMSNRGDKILFLVHARSGSLHLVYLFRSVSPFVFYQPVLDYDTRNPIVFPFTPHISGSHVRRRTSLNTEYLALTFYDRFGIFSYEYQIADVSSLFRYVNYIWIGSPAKVSAISPDGKILVGTLHYPWSDSPNYPFRTEWLDNRWNFKWDATHTGELLSVNANGHAVGYWIRAEKARPIIWRANESPIELPMPAREGFTPLEGWADDISDGGIVVGSVRDHHGEYRAFLWTSRNGFSYLDDMYSSILPPECHFAAATAISPNGRYILVSLVFNNGCSSWGVIDTKEKPLLPSHPIVVYRNITEPTRAYPYVDDEVEFRIFIEETNSDRHYTQDSSSQCLFSQIENPEIVRSRWLRTGTNFNPSISRSPRQCRGEAPDFVPWEVPIFRHQGKLYPVQTVYPWSFSELRFSWYEIYSQQDQETVLTEHMGHDTAIYPQYRIIRLQSNNWTWRTRLIKGTHRVVVRAIVRQGATTKVFGQYQPTPGKYSPTNSPINWDLTWSQNCDEARELAVRVSVRDRVRVTDPNRHQTSHGVITEPLRRSMVEWLSTFIRVPYEWGGYWYGGRADNSDGRLHTYEGYGIDCSGLICAAAAMSGFSAFQRAGWRTNAAGLNTGTYTDPVNLIDLEPGDILNYPEIPCRGGLPSS